MTSVQMTGAGICAFMAWWSAMLIRSARRQRRWPRTQARFLGLSRWGARCRVAFVLPDGTEVTTSSALDGQAHVPASGNAVAIVYDPCNPTRCEPAMTAGGIAVLRLLAVTAMAGGVVIALWG